MRILSSFTRAMARFRLANEANVVLTFALVTLPIMGFVGAAVDYSRANAVKAVMQQAVDATALMLSRSAAGLTDSELAAAANAYFSALFNRPEVTGLVITPIYTSSGGTQLVVSGAGRIETTFLRAMGFSSLSVNVSSTVRWGNSRLRVALVLDNTGSMADNGKLSALKTATKNLLSQLQSTAANPGDVYVSVIPFSKDVAVDPISNSSANWVDWTDWDAANAGNSHSTWNGCITDRGDSTGPNAGNYDTNVLTATVGNRATLFPAEQDAACPAKTMALSYNWSAMTALVDSMSANGTTNQAIGLAWGWLSLVGGGPFPTPPAMDPSYSYQQVIILLTDGLNTQDRWYGDGAHPSTQIDTRQALTCSNVKAAGITVYAIQVNTAGDPTSTLLQQCASDLNKFFLLTSSSDIITTFNQIGTNLANLRLTK